MNTELRTTPIDEMADAVDLSEVDRLAVVRGFVSGGRTYRLRASGGADDRVAVELIAEDTVTGDNEVGLRGTVLVSDLAEIATSLTALLNGISTALGHGQPTKAARLADLRRRHPNAYRVWSADEEARLTERFGAGASVAELAREFGRRPGAVTSRLVKLGLIAPDADDFG